MAQLRMSIWAFGGREGFPHAMISHLWQKMLFGMGYVTAVEEANESAKKHAFCCMLFALSYNHATHSCQCK